MMPVDTKKKSDSAPEEDPSFKIIKRPNDLKSKAGSGGLPPVAMERAQRAALAMKDTCLEEVKIHLVQIEGVLQRERSGDHDLLRAELSRLAAEVYAFCGSCGLSVVGNIAQSLDRLIQKEGPLDSGDLALIEPHIRALRFAAAEFSRPMGSEEHCKVLLNELRQAVAERLD